MSVYTTALARGWDYRDYTLTRQYPFLFITAWLFEILLTLPFVTESGRALLVSKYVLKMVLVHVKSFHGGLCPSAKTWGPKSEKWVHRLLCHFIPSSKAKHQIIVDAIFHLYKCNSMSISLIPYLVWFPRLNSTVLAIE
jgi:hypothetical protein